MKRVVSTIVFCCCFGTSAVATGTLIPSDPQSGSKKTAQAEQKQSEKKADAHKKAKGKEEAKGQKKAEDKSRAKEKKSEKQHITEDPKKPKR